MTLLEKGKQKVLEYQLEEMIIKRPSSWDKKWRLVVFDIPKNLKKTREAIRAALKRLGFYQYQKSVFIHPYECKNEIDFLIEFYDTRKYIRYIIATEVDNELQLKEIFKSEVKKR
jgi:CRISPR-associated endonuclease Cas2